MKACDVLRGIMVPTLKVGYATAFTPAERWDFSKSYHILKEHSQVTREQVLLWGSDCISFLSVILSEIRVYQVFPFHSDAGRHFLLVRPMCLALARNILTPPLVPDKRGSALTIQDPPAIHQHLETGCDLEPASEAAI